MFRLNLGCGPDLRPGYTNIDFLRPSYVPEGIDFQLVDLSKFPWPWMDGSAEEILLLDFLEHFPYSQTETILHEIWRILGASGIVDIQVPDFEHCARAVISDEKNPLDFQCNRCGEWMSGRLDDRCPRCHQSRSVIQDAAIHRLYGGQNIVGNWHYTAFTEDVLRRHLETAGFVDITSIENEHQKANWNLKLRSRKGSIDWGVQ